MGYIICRATSKRVTIHQWTFIALCLFCANAPDLDFIPGLLIGNANHYHHGISHSLGFALIFAVAFSVLFILLKKKFFIKNFFIFFFLYFSHICLDYFSIDLSFPYGVPIFWPFSNKYYTPSFAFLPSIARGSSSWCRFIVGFFSLNNLWAASVEIFLLVPFLLLVLIIRKQ